MPRVDPLLVEASAHAAAIERKFVLAACLDPETREKLEPALARSMFEVHYVPAVRHATKLVGYIRFDLIVVAYVVRGQEIDLLLHTIRLPASPNVSARVALLAAPELLAEARQCSERYATKTLASSLGQLELQDAVLQLAQSRARLHVRALTRVSVCLSGATVTQLLCPTRDLSRSGLLAITDSRIPVGSSVQFALDLPDGSMRVHGVAEVVRHASESRDRVDGLGLRFVSFATAGEHRLATFLDNR